MTRWIQNIKRVLTIRVLRIDLWRISSLSCLFFVCGCAWFGVETLKPVELDKDHVYVADINKTNDLRNRIDIGFSLSEVIDLIGNPILIETKNELKLYVYPSKQKIKSGVVVCLGLVPVPARSENDGEYHLYFSNEKLVRITSLETKSGFHGVYIDDSGSGLLNGEKSKCNM